MARNRYKGFKELLLVLGEEVTEAAKKALEEGAKAIVEDAKTRVPVKTGKLRDSINYKVQANGTRIKITAGATNKGMPYGQYVEYNPKINHPFLYPAKDAQAGRIKDNLIQAVKDGVKHV